MTKIIQLGLNIYWSVIPMHDVAMGCVDISNIISSLYSIGRFRQVFVLSEPLELIV